MKPCIYRSDVTDTDCTCHSKKLIHAGRVVLSVCSRCPYVTPPARDFFAATDQLSRRQAPRTRQRRRCGGCTSSASPNHTSRNAEPLRPEAAHFVWVYWHKGACDDELRWSMRSVLKHYQGDVQMTVIGDRPPWYTGHWIRQRRVRAQKNRSFRDMLSKMHTLANTPDVSPKFVWMMDDIYLLNNCTLHDLETPRCDRTWHGTPRNKWQRLKSATMVALAEHGFPQYDYATHLPHVVEQDRLQEVFRRFELQKRQHTLLWELLYGNMFRRTPRAHNGFFARTLTKQPKEHYAAWRNRGITIMNHGHSAWNTELKQWLQLQFPEPTRYEAQA